jgi:hypothetical protein
VVLDDGAWTVHNLTSLSHFVARRATLALAVEAAKVL